MDPELGLHHAALSVTDLHASSAWYQRVLGLEEEIVMASEVGGMAVLRLPGSGHAVGLVQHGGSGRDRAFDPREVGLDHLAFTVASRPALVAWTSRLDHHGIGHSGVIDIPPGAVLNFKDPDGIALVLFWDRPSDPPPAPPS